MNTNRCIKIIACILLVPALLMTVLFGCTEPQLSATPTGSNPAPTNSTATKPTKQPTVPTQSTVTTVPTEPTEPTVPTTPTEPTQPSPPTENMAIPEKYRKNIYLMGKDCGFCEVMTGTAMVTVIFVSDPSSAWDEGSITLAKNSINKDEARLESDAAAYGASYDVAFTYLETTISFVCDPLDSDLPYALEALKTLGLDEAYEDKTYLKELYQVDSAPVVFVLNTRGRAFARSCRYGYDGMEFVTLYSSELTALRHEISHLYGAMDFYYPFEVRDLADQYLTNSIMINSGTGVVDPITAYLIGWTNELAETAVSFLDATNHITMRDFMEAHEADSRTGYGTKPVGTGTYTGWMVRGVPHGEGTLTSANGDVYTGNWVNGVKHGKGTMKWANGDVYTGDWENNYMQGTGELYVASTGEKYIGQFYRNARKGQGTCFFENGDMYMGAWSNSKPHGYGEMLCANGDSYKGNFSYGSFSGQGTMEWADGSKYTGEWKYGKRNGQGEKIEADGERYVGEFKNGVRSGTGTCYYVNGDVYTGTWDSGLMHGTGKMTFANGDVYEGDFTYGGITGQGEMTYANGDRYDGDFQNGKRHGQGTCYYKDGTEFTGTWENDQPVT